MMAAAVLLLLAVVVVLVVVAMMSSPSSLLLLSSQLMMTANARWRALLAGWAYTYESLCVAGFLEAHTLCAVNCQWLKGSTTNSSSHTRLNGEATVTATECTLGIAVRQTERLEGQIEMRRK